MIHLKMCSTVNESWTVSNALFCFSVEKVQILLRQTIILKSCFLDPYLLLLLLSCGSLPFCMASRVALPVLCRPIQSYWFCGSTLSCYFSRASNKLNGTCTYSARTLSSTNNIWKRLRVDTVRTVRRICSVLTVFVEPKFNILKRSSLMRTSTKPPIFVCLFDHHYSELCCIAKKEEDETYTVFNSSSFLVSASVILFRFKTASVSKSGFSKYL